jgi:hypothetical protein
VKGDVILHDLMAVRLVGLESTRIEILELHYRQCEKRTVLAAQGDLLFS